MRILYVEDDLLNRKVVECLLRPYYEVHLATSVEEAVKKLVDYNGEFDIVLLDVNLGGKSGIELLKHIKNTDPLKNIPLVALTAYAMSGDREKLLREGFDGYLAKPFRKENLIQIIEQLIQRGQNDRQKLL